ncbi:uncharacterized protein V6R79_022250 [Siganus canaliculatus]
MEQSWREMLRETERETETTLFDDCRTLTLCSISASRFLCLVPQSDEDKMHIIAQICVLFLWMHSVTVVQSQACTREAFVKSKLYDANFDLTNLADSYNSGKQVRVSCAVGYSGFFKLICSSGKWQQRGSKCQPRSCGHPGDAQFADFQLDKGDDFVFGSEVVYTCHQGYQMVSRSNVRRCMAEGWDGVVPVCEAQTCPVVHVDNNVIATGDTEEANYGNVIRFSCKNNNQVLVGSSEIYCDELGQWNDDAPKCQPIICSAPNIENGYVPQARDEYEENDILHFECNAKFKRAEERSSKCMKIGTKAEWSPTPMCERIKCRLELPALAGTVYDPPFKNVFLPDEEVQVTCAPKYYIFKPQSESLTSTCQDNGEWTVRPICEEVTCGNRKVWPVSSWDVKWWERVTLGYTTRYWCAGGYRKTGNMATCSRNGWSPSPLCEEITCPRHIDANAVCEREREDEFKYDARVTCDCKEGFWGRYTLTCRDRGWTGYQACREITCPRHIDENAVCDGETQDEFNHNDQIHCNCKEGFRGRYTVSCGEHGWTGKRACTRITCPLGNVQYAVRNAVSLDPKFRYYYNETVKFACNEGYRGSPYRVCTETGWIGDSQCTVLAEITCPRHIDGNAVCDGETQDEFRYNDQVSCNCKEGFRGRYTLTCGERGWTGYRACEEDLCQSPNIEDAEFSGTVQKTYKNEEKVEYSCKDSTRHTITCEGGEWQNIHRCTVEKCVKPEIPKGHLVTQDKTEYNRNEKITYTCLDDFKRTFSLTCGKTGWIGRSQCTTCPKVEVQHGLLTGPYDNKLYLKCADTYKLFSKGWWAEVTCEDKEWSGLDHCIEETECGDIPVIPNSKMTPPTTASKNEESFPIVCNDGYEPQVQSLVCQNGNWTWEGQLDQICTPVPNLCDPPPRVQNATIKEPYQKKYSPGHKVTYLCRDKYHLRGEGTLRCLETGEWEEKIIECIHRKNFKIVGGGTKQSCFLFLNIQSLPFLPFVLTTNIFSRCRTVRTNYQKRY